MLAPERLKRWGMLTLLQRRARIIEMYRERGIEVNPSGMWIWHTMRRHGIRHLCTSYQIQTKVSEENLVKQRRQFVVKMLGLLV